MDVAGIAIRDLSVRSVKDIASLQADSGMRLWCVEFNQLPWLLWVGTVPRGFCWGFSPPITQAIEPWRQRQCESDQVYNSFQTELKQAGLTIRNLPAELLPYGHLNARGESSPIGTDADSVNILRLRSWLTPNEARFRCTFPQAFDEAVEQFGKWSVRRLGTWDEAEQLALAFNRSSIEDRSIEVAALLGGGWRRGEDFGAAIRMQIDWLDGQEACSPEIFPPGALNHSSIDLFQWRDSLFTPGSRAAIAAELALARARYLARCQPPFLYWGAKYSLELLAEAPVGGFASENAPETAREVVQALEAYLKGVAERYPAFVINML